MPPTGPLSVAVVGVGRIGLMHARNLLGSSGVREIVVTDPTPGRAEAVAAELAGASVGVRVVGDLESAVATSDAVLVTTPTPSHPDVVRAALAAGRPTLCEKPLAADLGSIAELADLSDRLAVPLMVGFQRRFDPGLAELRRRVRTGEVGDLYLVRATAFDHEPPDPAYVPTSGGVFRDMLIHDLDALPWVVGRPVRRVQAVGSVLVDPIFAACDDVDTVAVTLEFEGGVIGQISGGRRQGYGYDNRLEVIGSKQAVVAGVGPRSPLALVDAGADPAAASAPGQAFSGFAERYAPAYAAEIATFLRLATGEVENPSPAQDSLVSLRLAQACEQSLRSGAPVDLMEVSV